MLTHFYRRAEFDGVPGRAAPPVALPDGFRLHGLPDYRHGLIMSRFKSTFPEYVGVLRGEYLALENGHALVDRDGETILINCSADDIWASKDLNELFIELPQQQHAVELTQRWSALPIVDRVAIVSHPYADNYYHFCLDTVTKLRFLDEFEVGTVAVPDVCLSRGFQYDLLSRTQRGRKIMPMRKPFRIRNPVLAHGYMSTTGLDWLRDTAGIRQQAGTRRIYVHRTNLSRTTPGNCVAHTPEFAALLAEYGFETVNFGDGERGIERQVALLEGAGLVLGAHGASMTNIAFIQPPATIVELFGTRVFGGFMDIAARLSLGYHGILCWDFDDQADIVVDCVQLRAVLDAALADQARLAARSPRSYGLRACAS